MRTKSKKANLILIMIVYLLGIFMGAIDTGIVTPARTIIQNFLSVDDKTGIWMITIYTLAYAASIPVMGKLADKFGRKYIYLISIFLFGLGSLFCGLSKIFGSFSVLLISRTVQAIGGGGIVPVATAEFGTTFPKEKRGLALGLVGGVYGLANILGSSAGSAILDLFGTDNWNFIFYINIPITLFIVVAGILCLPNSKATTVKKIDFVGISILTIMILSLLYGLKNIDFFDFITTITSIRVFPFLLLVLILLPIFLLSEKKAQDPVIDLNYFKNSKIVITLILSFLTGFILMGMIFVPQFSENTLKIASGSGGYFVFFLGLFAGIAAPVSGKLIDKFGVKLVLGFGFLVSALGALFLVLVTTNYPSFFTVFISLMLVGIGIGFTMGTPLNYMMLEHTKKEDASSALAAVSLVRSIGTAIAPAIMIGFLSHAGALVQGNLLPLLPNKITIPELPYAKELTDTFHNMKSDPNMADQLNGIILPDLTSMQTIAISMDSTNMDFELPKELIDQMKASDVTTIVKDMKNFSSAMFDRMTPPIIQKIQTGIQKGITAMEDTTSDMEQGMNGMNAAVLAQSDAIHQLEAMTTFLPAISEQNSSSSLLDLIPEKVMASIPEKVISELGKIKTLNELQLKIDELKLNVASLNAQIENLEAAKKEMTDLVTKMRVLQDTIPGAFATAQENYLLEIDGQKFLIETKFQSTLNEGFRQVYLTVTIVSLLSFLILLIYRRNNVGQMEHELDSIETEGHISA